MKNHYFLVLAAIFISGCGSDTDKVKNGILEFNKTITVGQALDNWKSCESRKWEEFSSENGVKVVQFTCNHKVKEYMEKVKSYVPSEIESGAIYLDVVSYVQTFQFTMNKDDTFQAHNASIEMQWADGEKSQSNQAPMEQLSLAYENKMNFEVSELNESVAPQFSFYMKLGKPGEKYKKTPQKAAASTPAGITQKIGLCQSEENNIFSCVTENNVTYSLCVSKDITKNSGYMQLHFKSDKGAGIIPENQLHPSQFSTADILTFSGGGGAYIRFKGGEKTSYVVYSAMGKDFDKQGVAIEANGKILLNNSCKNITANDIGPDFFEKSAIPKDDFGFDVPFDEISSASPTENSEAANETTSKTWLPSFNCNNASTFVEKSICSVKLLGSLDGALSENYKYMLASDIGESAQTEIKLTQKIWLAERNRCTSENCIEEKYRKRIDEVCDYPVNSGVHPVCATSSEIK